MASRKRRGRSRRMRIGKISIYEHHGSWWVYYRENGKPIRQRIGDDPDEAKGDYAFLNGGMVTKAPFGFRKLSIDEAESGQFGPKGLRIAKIPEATPVIREIRDRVMQGDTYESIATWLNDEIVGLAWCIREHFTGKYIAGYLRNTTLLHGERQRSRHQVIRLRTTGRKKHRLNPDPLTMVYPELAHLTPEEHADLIAEMDRRVTEHPRKRRAKVGPKGRARSRSHFPGQAMTCSVCGSVYYWHGNGCLKCSDCGDPAKGQCWNHLQVEPVNVRNQVAEVLLRRIEEHPEAKAAFVQAALAECERLRGRGGREQSRLEEQIKRLRTEKKALASAIRKGGDRRRIQPQMPYRGGLRDPQKPSCRCGRCRAA